VFRPWIGNDYASGYRCCDGSRKRTLILGESYYEKDAQRNPLSNRSNLTREIIKQQIDCTWIHRFYTRIARTFLSHPPTCPERPPFWHSVAYYVFIQAIVGSRAGQRPTRLMWQAGAVPFALILKKYEPRFVLVCGKELWNWLPIAKNNAWTSRARQGMICKEALPDGKTVLFCGIMHPSRRDFAPDVWHSFVKSAMKLA
jgi:hypothetical protein